MKLDIIPRTERGIDWKRMPARVSVGAVLVWFVVLTLAYGADIMGTGLRNGFTWREPVAFGGIVAIMGFGTLACLLLLRWLNVLLTRPRRYGTPQA